eukprot:284815792_5
MKHEGVVYSMVRRHCRRKIRRKQSVLAAGGLRWHRSGTQTQTRSPTRCFGYTHSCDRHRHIHMCVLSMCSVGMRVRKWIFTVDLFRSCNSEVNGMLCCIAEFVVSSFGFNSGEVIFGTLLFLIFSSIRIVVHGARLLRLPFCPGLFQATNKIFMRNSIQLKAGPLSRPSNQPTLCDWLSGAILSSFLSPFIFLFWALLSKPVCAGWKPQNMGSAYPPVPYHHWHLRVDAEAAIHTRSFHVRFVEMYFRAIACSFVVSKWALHLRL